MKRICIQYNLILGGFIKEFAAGYRIQHDTEKVWLNAVVVERFVPEGMSYTPRYELYYNDSSELHSFYDKLLDIFCEEYGLRKDQLIHWEMR